MLAHGFTVLRQLLGRDAPVFIPGVAADVGGGALAVLRAEAANVERGVGKAALAALAGT